MATDRAVDVVLEGGGVKGIALVGALAGLAEAGYEFRRVGGTSAGAMVGALIAAGWSTDELAELLWVTDFEEFADKSWIDRIPGGRLVSLLTDEGIYEGAALRAWMERQLGSAGATFGDLALDAAAAGSLTGDRRYRLVVNVSDVSLGRLVQLPWDYRSRYGLDPDTQRVADAVRASTAIPFFYEPERLAYPRSGHRGASSVLVDGGMLSNFPVDLFDVPAGTRPRWPTFGIKLSSKPDAIGERFPTAVKGPIDLGKAMLSTLIGFHDAIHIEEPDAMARTIFVDTFGVQATDFDLGAGTKRRLFESGRRAAAKFLEGWDFDEYVATFRS